jgi:hypothetical protein
MFKIKMKAKRFWEVKEPCPWAKEQGKHLLCWDQQARILSTSRPQRVLPIGLSQKALGTKVKHLGVKGISYATCADK